MKKFLLRATTIFLVLVIVLTAFPITSFAATTTGKYETIKNNIPVWTKPSSKSTKAYRIEYEGTIVEVKSSVKNEAKNLWYELTDGNWIFSGNVRKHKCAGAMCGMEKRSYEYIDTQTHKRVGKMDELCLCKAVLDTKTNIKYEQHSFGSNNLCACGYKKSEIHIHAYKNGVCACGVVQHHTHTAVACGEETISYNPKDAATHMVIRTIPHLCSCGFELGKEQKTDAEGHSFSITGKCKQCGYQKHICKASSGGNKSVSYEQSSQETHIKVTRTTDVVCSCGAIVKKGTTTLEAEKHILNSNNICTACGYKVHVHAVSSQRQATHNYTQKNSSSHTVTSKVANLCSCGTVISYTTTTKSESHSFDANNNCKQCGTHAHKIAKLKSLGGKYLTQSNSAHIFEEVILELCFCGKAMNTKTVQTTQQHNFDSNGKCLCKYTKESETHKHLATKRGEAFISYSSKDNKTHLVSEKAPNICKCGTIIDFATISTKEKAHRFKNDICQDCGVRKTYDFLEVNASQIVEQAVKGNYSNDVTLAGIVAEIIVGELPYGVGLVADVRDVVSDIQNDAGFVTTIVDVVALIPAGGIIKYADEATAASQGAKKIVKRVSNVDDPYDSYRSFKKAYGPAGDGLEYHHIVEQSQVGKRANFSSKMVNNGSNMVVLDRATHQKISQFYSTKDAFTGLRFRDTLANKSFEEQYRIGLEVLERFGVVVK